MDNVSYKYPEGVDYVLCNARLEIPFGARVAIVGSSGAGKSTLVDLLLGLLQPQVGTILVDDRPLTRADERSWRSQIGYVPQQVFMSDASLRENIALGLPTARVDRVSLERAVKMASLEKLVASLPNGLDTPIGERGIRLSGGERQRVAIARALYRNPRVLFLDEATSNLDVLTERAIHEEVLGLGAEITVVVVTHRVHSLKAFDRLFLLDRNAVAATGTYDELAEGNALFAEMARQTWSCPAS